MANETIIEKYEDGEQFFIIEGTCIKEGCPGKGTYWISSMDAINKVNEFGGDGNRVYLWCKECQSEWPVNYSIKVGVELT
jgi:hypothetical protein